jgi:HlyD family secretion protein
MKRFQKPLIGAVVVLLAVVGVASFWSGEADEKQYLTGTAEIGTVDVAVSATGTVQPVTTVQIGSQASGTVAWIGVDYNSPVKKGQIIARLDPATVQTQIANASASVSSAQASREASAGEIEAQQASIDAARANVDAARARRDDAAALVKRYEGLANVVAARDIEAARTQAAEAVAQYNQSVAQLRQAEASLGSVRARREQANAALAQAQAQLQQASVNLDNTVITSPIDGVVVSRAVDVGQTVAASLQAPVLFTIANDLSKMQILAAIDEADVGQIREGLEVRSTVDTFPNDTFRGRVAQVRLEATTQENVVTYTAVVEVDNPDLKLRPGMTANVEISVERRENVLTVPNAALRFRPELSDEDREQLRESIQARRGGSSSERGDRQRSQRPEGNAAADRQTVWVLTADKKLEPRRVRTGLTDGRVTEVVESDLREGDTVVTGQTGGETAERQQQSGSSPLSGGRTRGPRGR